MKLVIDTTINLLSEELLLSSFLLFQHGKLVAASPTLEAHDAACRLLCDYEGLCIPTSDKREQR